MKLRFYIHLEDMNRKRMRRKIIKLLVFILHFWLNTSCGKIIKQMITQIGDKTAQLELER